MNDCKKIILEWIPNAYSENTDIQAQKEPVPPRRQDFLIVKSMDLYRAKAADNKTNKRTKQ